MKILYTLLICTLCSIGVQAQGSYDVNPVFSLTFEDTSIINLVFYTDSIIDPQGIWQIGSPHKSFMNSALSQPNGAVTLIDSLLPPRSNGSFIITLPIGLLSSGEGALLTFAHRYQFDTAHGGGYVEFSVDTGRHWHGIYQDTALENCNNVVPVPDLGFSFGQMDTVDGQIVPLPAWWDKVRKDTTSAGILYFTGTDSVWIIDTIVFPVFFISAKASHYTQYMFRFTAYTDSLSPALGGWLIDNINYSSFLIICPGGINEINSAHLHVYPDPATDAFNISLLNEPESDYEVTLYDLSGRVVMRQDFTGQEVMMYRGGTDAGSYFIQVMDRRTQNTFQKRIVFD